MSIEVYTQEEIVRHVENASPTKYMYSFGKAERFPAIKRRGKSDTFYDLPSVKMNRTAGFGYGTKYDFTKNANRNEITSVRRDFDPGSATRSPSYSFGLSREAYKKAWCPGYKNLDKFIPGPAKYNVIKTLGNDSPKYTFRRRDIKAVGKFDQSTTPGPGHYPPVVKINSKGKYPTSKISNILVSDFGADHSQRYNFLRKQFKIFIAFNFLSI